MGPSGVVHDPVCAEFTVCWYAPVSPVNVVAQTT
jgi:hypothetical protein